KGDDLIELAAYLGARHAENGAVEVDVLAAGELGVEAGADLEQARHTAFDRDATLGRFGDARQDLEQCRFAGAVAADDAHHLAALHLEAHVLESPEFLRGVADDEGAAAQHVSRRAGVVADTAGDDIAQRGIALALRRLVAYDVALAQPFSSDDDVADHTASGIIRSGRQRFALCVENR